MPEKATSLLAYLVDNRPHLLNEPLGRWLADSPRFAAFVQAHQSKIRRKIREAASAEKARDLLAELQVAYRLLQVRSFEVFYETQGRPAGRAPDFTVIYKTHTPFHVEATRLQPPAGNLVAAEEIMRLREGRLHDLVGDKISQLLTGAPNVLVIVTDGDALSGVVLDEAMKRLKLRAERKDVVLLGRHGYEGPADFFKYFQRLSAVVLADLSEGESANSLKPLARWTNNQARHLLTAKILANVL